MALVATLQIVRVRVMPRLRACLRAARVSAVSPLWLMVMIRVRGSGTLSRYRYSLATSTVVGMPAMASSQ